MSAQSTTEINLAEQIGSAQIHITHKQAHPISKLSQVYYLT